ncbi:DUF3127 domain-containing protein [Winogradskyella eximia]|uniref:DUF3127 domain-containing protein n=1 Tax=Winogradskyella eximia TaxID=262006 RepID=UPI002492C050|nr:DUF3127 domain-containing protein [Winogradskyella eximia]
MIHLQIQGEIIHIFTPVKYDSAMYGQPDFTKQKILIEVESQQYTLSFLNKKIDLLKHCRLGSIIEVGATLKGRTWRFNNKSYSVNDLVCNSLKIIKNTIFNGLVRFDNKIYNIQKKNKNENIDLNLVNIENGSKYQLTIAHDFPNKSKNKNHVLISDKVDKELLKYLEEIGALSIKTWKQTADGVSGTICRVLILDLFENRELLYSKTQEKEAIQRKYSDDSIIPFMTDFKNNNSTKYEDYERDYFNAMTDGQAGNYDDFIDNSGDIDNINTWSRG